MRFLEFGGGGRGGSSALLISLLFPALRHSSISWQLGRSFIPVLPRMHTWICGVAISSAGMAVELDSRFCGLEISPHRTTQRVVKTSTALRRPRDGHSVRGSDTSLIDGYLSTDIANWRHSRTRAMRCPLLKSYC